MDMHDSMDWRTCLIWWTDRYAWFDTDLVISLKHSPDRYIDASFLYVYLHSDDNYDSDSDDDDDDSDDDSDDSDDSDDRDSDDNDDRDSDDNDYSENGDYNDRNIDYDDV